jgi:hypothetical protein
MAMWLILVPACAPWAAGIAYLWRRSLPQDGSLPLSVGELARRRLTAL